MFLLPKGVEGKVQGYRATDPRPSEKTSGLGEVSVLTDHFSSSRATELSCNCVNKKISSTRSATFTRFFLDFFLVEAGA